MPLLILNPELCKLEVFKIKFDTFVESYLICKKQKMEFENKNVIITGASKGIGFATAKEFADNGSNLIIVARNEDDLKQATKSFDSKTKYFVADLSEKSELEQFVKFVKQNWDRVDVLVNNVGTNIRKKTEDVSYEIYEKIMNTNLNSAFHITRMLYPLLKKSEQSNIVFVSSVAGLTYVKTGAVYAMSKAAMNQLVKNLAVEWAENNIRVNAVAPWYIATPLAKQVLKNETYLQEVLNRTPMKRVGEPKEVANVIRFLASDDASYVTGQTIAVDGGFTIYGF